ncbi:hypothetical protein Syun_001815 [Stephania yunnanensis]|uniref:Uncharacterized protein n=1 Tax=Stephania yunnanensis TaxID=152371 RepID=A0AAP0Q6U2_9MAGN
MPSNVEHPLNPASTLSYLLGIWNLESNHMRSHKYTFVPMACLFDIFVMKKYGERDSWYKLRTIPAESLAAMTSSWKVVGFSDNGKVLPHGDRPSLLQYDSENGMPEEGQEEKQEGKGRKLLICSNDAHCTRKIKA